MSRSRVLREMLEVLGGFAEAAPKSDTRFLDLLRDIDSRFVQLHTQIKAARRLADDALGENPNTFDWGEAAKILKASQMGVERLIAPVNVLQHRFRLRATGRSWR